MNKLSTRHFMFFIIACTTIAIRSYSSLFIQYGKRDTYLLSLFASIFILIYFLFLMYICKKSNTYNLNIIMGKPFKFLFAIGLFLASIESSSVEASSIHSNYFLDTPTWYCLLFFIIACGYCLLKKFNSILILVLTTVTLILIGDVIFFALAAKYLDLSFLLPIMKNGITKDKILCFLGLIGSLASVVISLPYLENLDKKENLLKDSSFSIIISCLLMVFSLISIIGFFGPIHAANIFFPEYVESQRVQIAGFLEYGELFYIFRSVCSWFVKYILSSYGILLLYKDKIKNRKLFLTCYSIIVFIASFIFTQNQYFLFDSLKILLLVNIVLLIIIPLISFTIFYINRNNIKKNQEKSF